MAGISVGTRFRANTGHAKGRTRWLLDGISRAMRRLLGGLKPDPAMVLSSPVNAGEKIHRRAAV